MNVLIISGKRSWDCANH